MAPSKKKEIRIPRSAEWVKYLESRLCNSHILEDLVFPEMRDESMNEIMKRLVEIFEHGGIEKEKYLHSLKQVVCSPLKT